MIPPLLGTVIKVDVRGPALPSLYSQDSIKGHRMALLPLLPIPSERPGGVGSGRGAFPAVALVAEDPTLV